MSSKRKLPDVVAAQLHAGQAVSSGIAERCRGLANKWRIKAGVAEGKVLDGHPAYVSMQQRCELTGYAKGLREAANNLEAAVLARLAKGRQ